MSWHESLCNLECCKEKILTMVAILFTQACKRFADESAIVKGSKAQELEAAQQEVMALRARVQQLESDTHSSSSLELKNLSLQQVRHAGETAAHAKSLCAA